MTSQIACRLDQSIYRPIPRRRAKCTMRKLQRRISIAKYKQRIQSYSGFPVELRRMMLQALITEIRKELEQDKRPAGWEYMLDHIGKILAQLP